MQTGVTDVMTAKSVARKLYQSYTSGSECEREALSCMLADTYKMMFRPTPQDIDLYAELLDFNGDGRISIEDFESLAVKYLARTEAKTYTKNVKERLQVARRLFEKFDVDKSGFLSQEDIPALLVETYAMMGVVFKPTKEDIDSWMQMTDLDGDGKVNLQDYERLVIQSLERCGVKIYQRE